MYFFCRERNRCAEKPSSPSSSSSSLHFSHCSRSPSFFFSTHLSTSLSGQINFPLRGAKSAEGLAIDSHTHTHHISSTGLIWHIYIQLILCFLLHTLTNSLSLLLSHSQSSFISLAGTFILHLFCACANLLTSFFLSISRYIFGFKVMDHSKGLWYLKVESRCGGG